jgi:hypothetical protein
MSLATIRAARKEHRCDRCRSRIQPGDLYRAAAITPGSDIGNVGWWHEKECAACASMCGRPIPMEA